MKNLLKKKLVKVLSQRIIITIIILLILAVVAIGAVNNTGIIQYAQNSADEYTDKRDKENEMVGNYLGIINHYKPKEDNTNPPDPEPEEILWAFVDWGDEEYELDFIGNVDELDLSQDKEVKAYVASFNDDTEELEYDENSEIATIKLSAVTSIYMYGGSIKNLILGQVAQGKIENIDDWGVKNLNILESFKEIPTDFCKNENVLESIIIGEGVENITYGSFHHCEALKSLTLPSTLEIIGRLAFAGCSNLNNIILPVKISSIGENAFGNCTNLTSITIKKAQGSLDLSNSGLTADQIASVVWAPEE